MIVQSSSIGMNSARRYNSKSLSYSGMKVWDNKTRTTAGVGQAALANQAENESENDSENENNKETSLTMLCSE